MRTKMIAWIKYPQTQQNVWLFWLAGDNQQQWQLIASWIRGDAGSQSATALFLAVLESHHSLFFIFLFYFIFLNFGDANWWLAEAWIVLLAGAVEVKALAQGALRQFTQWLCIEHPTFQRAKVDTGICSLNDTIFWLPNVKLCVGVPRFKRCNRPVVRMHVCQWKQRSSMTQQR